MKRTWHSLLAAIVAIAVAGGSASAGDLTPNPPNPHVMKGTVLKYSQPIQHVIDPDPMFMDRWGENIWSDFDWKKVMEPQSPTQPIPPNWIIADDFRDPFDTPVLTVRWWGSYDNETFHQDPASGEITPISGPGSEDGYAISFFRDIPADPEGGVPFSRPGELLGTYVLPFEKVWVEPTDHIGWDEHEIFEYKANLMDAHLDHPSDLADPMGFNQRPGEIYWISIAAFVGHKPVLVTDPDGTTRWEVEDTNKFGDLHYWGWHTSPVQFNDVATMGHLFMPENQWIYDQWMPIQPDHHLFDMAFELYTIPEPASALMLAIGIVAALGVRRRS